MIEVYRRFGTTFSIHHESLKLRKTTNEQEESKATINAATHQTYHCENLKIQNKFFSLWGNAVR
jgi:hypothetical protein